MVVTEILPDLSYLIDKVNSCPRPQAAFNWSCRARKSTISFSSTWSLMFLSLLTINALKSCARGERDRGGGRMGKVVALTMLAMAAVYPSSAKSSPPTRA
ncbi:hypothetical protein U1Q18_050027 [Sarracenia purpurea var. burkii]